MPSAERVNWAKFRVSAVGLAALTILGTIVYLLTRSTLFVSHATLYLYVPDGSGLVARSPVEVQGVGVGNVKSVVLSGSTDPDRVVKVIMTVARHRLSAIPADSTAQIASDTAIGDKYITISSGSSASPIQPNGEIHLKRSQELLKTLDIEQFQKRVDELDALIGDIEQGKSRVGEFVKGDRLYRNLLSRVAEIERAVNAAADTKNAIGRDLYTDRLFRQVHEPLTKLDQDLARLQSGQGSAGRFLRDPAQYQELRDGVGKLRSSVADLRKGPLLQSDQTYNDWNRQLALLIRKVDEFNANPMMATSVVYDNLNGAVREAQRAMKEFRENPKKFLRLKLF